MVVGWGSGPEGWANGVSSGGLKAPAPSAAKSILQRQRKMGAGESALREFPRFGGWLGGVGGESEGILLGLALAGEARIQR